ncbi:MAG TPA: hypothetical protein VFN25_00605 [Dokdonella sp.]|uniref:hypothetical protein n=1 Tax=Dokdonella sp. TaxID=2291710 RepID=UPI002D7E6F20|nr:hypothetical protein [Dokdonella sp.]HET9031380.1 hypothetical protein [Dokdonella sp.]
MKMLPVERCAVATFADADSIVIGEVIVGRALFSLFSLGIRRIVSVPDPAVQSPRAASALAARIASRRLQPEPDSSGFTTLMMAAWDGDISRQPMSRMQIAGNRVFMIFPDGLQVRPEPSGVRRLNPANAMNNHERS